LVHVAGIKDLAEAKMLVECGVSFLGFPLVLDVHREDLTVNEAAAIVAAMRSRATFFLITYLARSAEILDLRGSSYVCAILHDDRIRCGEW
jgi:phosphoribosylanthranilate isomerase